MSPYLYIRILLSLLLSTTVTARHIFRLPLASNHTDPYGVTFDYTWSTKTTVTTTTTMTSTSASKTPRPNPAIQTPHTYSYPRIFNTTLGTGGFEFIPISPTVPTATLNTHYYPHGFSTTRKTDNVGFITNTYYYPYGISTTIFITAPTSTTTKFVPSTHQTTLIKMYGSYTTITTDPYSWHTGFETIVQSYSWYAVAPSSSAIHNLTNVHVYSTPTSTRFPSYTPHSYDTITPPLPTLSSTLSSYPYALSPPLATSSSPIPTNLLGTRYRETEQADKRGNVHDNVKKAARRLYSSVGSSANLKTSFILGIIGWVILAIVVGWALAFFVRALYVTIARKNDLGKREVGERIETQSATNEG
ncbi:hypothetical protein P3342_002756 [Pyrenophora teres f. teres]|uniref:Uncharacterized protein n=1 Tax=Pyrenophora teres f. teres (strain 0-1) TaxID=861557 RepID=E3S377_PYRTT|nr:hypothetical protein PTT_16889 [Pyrenophora teres f. teres 0-1]KAK1920456.1 hypothetical protein P3342_002756 [Pyrenophora teres f. teres]